MTQVKKGTTLRCFMYVFGCPWYHKARKDGDGIDEASEHHAGCKYKRYCPQDKPVAIVWHRLVLARASAKRDGVSRQKQGPNLQQLLDDATARMKGVKEWDHPGGKVPLLDEPFVGKMKWVSVWSPNELRDLFKTVDEDKPWMGLQAKREAQWEGLEWTAPLNVRMGNRTSQLILSLGEGFNFRDMVTISPPSSAVYVQVSGTTVWVIFPPDYSPAAINSRNEESQMTVIERYMSLEGVKQGIKPLLVELNEMDGRALYVPPGWRTLGFSLRGGYVAGRMWVEESKLAASAQMWVAELNILGPAGRGEMLLLQWGKLLRGYRSVWAELMDLVGLDADAVLKTRKVPKALLPNMSKEKRERFAVGCWFLNNLWNFMEPAVTVAVGACHRVPDCWKKEKKYQELCAKMCSLASSWLTILEGLFEPGPFYSNQVDEFYRI